MPGKSGVALLPVWYAQGDTVSEAILRHGVGELLRSVKSVVSKLQLEECQQPYQVVLTGGLMVKGSLYTQYVHEGCN
ncbi:BcrAD_BadFG domain-containing protein, partial [Haematococcus lacustris]